MNTLSYSLCRPAVAAGVLLGTLLGLLAGTTGCAGDSGAARGVSSSPQPAGNTRPVVKQGGNIPPQPAAPDQADPPLVEAARAGDAGRVRTLLDAGADPNGFGAGRTTALMAAAEAGRSDLARMLMDRGADANLRNARGQTAAEVADAAGHRQLRVLLERKEVKPPPGPANPVPAK